MLLFDLETGHTRTYNLRVTTTKEKYEVDNCDGEFIINFVDAYNTALQKQETFFSFKSPKSVTEREVWPSPTEKIMKAVGYYQTTVFLRFSEILEIAIFEEVVYEDKVNG